MSTERQQQSPETQLEIFRQYAAAHNMEIVQAYSDHGRSGLNIAGRDGLNRLIADPKPSEPASPRCLSLT
jgi:DNA invertase Pin-like site-specific DNA recombinase